MNSASTLRVYYESLLAAYGPRQWWPAQTPFEVMVGAILVQSTAWQSVEVSIARLKAAHALAPAAMLALTHEELSTIIRPSGFMQRKASTLKSLCRWLVERYSANVAWAAQQPSQQIREELLSIPGIGPETADAVLLYALGHPVFVVDEYMRRIVTRHGLAPANAIYVQLQQLGDSAFQSDTDRAQHFNEFHALIVEVGKQHCRRRPICSGCPLAVYLPQGAIANPVQ